MTENKYLLDSSALVEYFDGTLLGLRVKKILDNVENECFVCGNVICEVTSKLVRKSFAPEDFFQSIKQQVAFISETSDEWFLAGKKHAELKKAEDRISYTDALLIILSESRKLKIVSKDAHLKDFNTLFLR